MRFVLLVAASILFLAPAAFADDDLIVKQSAHSVSQTLDRLAAALQKKGTVVFTRIDHAGGAKNAGVDMKPTELLVFGNPKLGAPLMQSNRKIGIDLPMKVLAWEDDDGKVWLAYTNPDELKDRFDIRDRDEVFKKMAGALDNLTSAAVKAE